ncbi:glycosyltransferase family 4 protein [Pedobacter sp. L105]|uniref:glycosyltransferase family 4 protein n=1 Tax=Pedobacter sp. L105 TaxID=1641871 RepID=UPI00131C9098|nr:glycosyltransferase [Pedobacter sp. L105]
MIVQRYGLEVNGGAEYHCRILAEKLTPLFEIEILTSCAKSHSTWANEYPEGETLVNDITVRRFPALQERDQREIRRLSKKLGKRSAWHKILRFFGLLEKVDQQLSPADLEKESYALAKAQGPFVPGLINYLEQHQEEYTALIFFTYLYFPTLYGLRVAPEKSILIPTAHDESAIYLPGFRSFFKLPKVILYNTKAEKNFVNQLFDNGDIYTDIAGVGIERYHPEKEYQSSDILKSEAPYFIYIGRIDKGKGCQMMIDYFLKYKKLTGHQVKLVLVGKAFMNVPENDAIISLGFVSEDIKQALLKDAIALIIPSLFESLSLVTLESMLEGIPVVANGHSAVLKDHIEESMGGFTFEDFSGFRLALDALIENKTDLVSLKRNAERYVTDKYNWNVVLRKFTQAVNYITSQKK